MSPRRLTHLSSRFLFDLEPWVGLNEPLSEVRNAKHLVRYFIDCVESGAQPDPLVLRYVSQACLRARKSGKLGRELGLTRPRRGNPGALSANRGKRLLSYGDRQEIIERLTSFATNARPRGALTREIGAIASEYKISHRRVEQLLEES